MIRTFVALFCIFVSLLVSGCTWTTESMFPYLKEHRRLEEQGEDAKAEILSVTQTGWTLNDQPELELELKIYPQGDEPFFAKTSLICPLIMIPEYRPGFTVPVKIDRLSRTATVAGSYRQTPGLQQ